MLLLSLSAQATHIRAGEITLRRLDPQSLEYEITLTGYADRGSSVLFGSNGVLDFGDGTFLELQNDGDSGSIPRQELTSDTWVYTLKVRHTFPSPGVYVVSFRELYRNEGVLNMDNSVNMPFYIETVIVIDGFLGVNNTPQLLVPPVDKAAVGKVYIHNPGAFDIDGDSLSYRLVFCKQDEDLPVANYRFPHETFPEGDARNGNSTTGGESTFTLDPITGDLVWDAPGTAGEYNAAFFIEEWRKVNGEYFFLGYVTRDMQIIVEDTDNNPPVLNMPQDTCVIAGTLLQETITADDPDNDEVKIESYGGVYSLGATYSPDDARFQNVPASVDFSWQTTCEHVRERPYAVQFKATDRRSVPLADLQTWNITVVAPAPEINRVEAINARITELDFDINNYACGDHAVQIQVWRRVDSLAFEPEACETGMPAGLGYELVGVRGVNDFPFQDNNNGLGLTPGATYCYRIVAVFPQPGGGESLVSEEYCVTMPAGLPLMTNVSIEETDPENGDVFVRWTSPIDIDVNDFPPPYFYDLYRSEGISGGNYSLVASDLSDTTYLDEGLNTEDIAFNYYVMLKNASGEIDSATAASSVRLEPLSLVGSIELNWQAETPWSNQVSQYPYHYIYRDNVADDPTEFVLIDSVNVLTQGFSYLDDGRATNEERLEDRREYCYIVTTQGSYGNPQVLSPLQNNSQRVCAMPNDSIPPCPPLNIVLESPSCEEQINTLPCGENQLSNTLSWTAQVEGSCQDDIAFYRIFYSSDGVNFEVIGETNQTDFTHENLSSLAGFYYIVAVDRSRNESERSEILITENCPRYWLPNVFTPNDDAYNNLFQAPQTDPARCPRFVQSVEFTVYNRWGKEVYFYDSDAEGQEGTIYIEWNGRTESGERLSSGTYYYIADVTFDVLDEARRNQVLKGWLQIVDGDIVEIGEGGSSGQ